MQNRGSPLPPEVSVAIVAAGGPSENVGVVKHRIVVGALSGPAGLLVVHRRPDKERFPDRWDFPGGHVEAGETEPEALARELHEEVGVRAVVVGNPAVRIESSARQLTVALWIVREWTGEPNNAAPDEHDDLRWVTVDQFQELDLALAAYRDLFGRAAQTRGGDDGNRTRVISLED